jgi:hypothetical protein
MKIISAIALLCLFLSAGGTTAFAQNTEKVKKRPVGIASIVKDTAREAEVLVDELPPPPPPRAMSGEGFSINPVDTAAIWTIDEVDSFYSDLQDTTAAPEDELTFEIRKLLKITAVVENWFQQANEKLKVMRAENGELPDEFYDLLEKEFKSDLAQRMYENVTIRVYRKYFNVEDVRALQDFYQSEIGKKTLILLPAVLNESIKNGSAIGSMLGIRAFEQLEKEGKIK